MKRTAFITGATRGIGRELVKQLADLDMSVFATGRDEALLDSLKSSTGCAGLAADLSDPDQVVELYREARATLGPIDILVNNAGFNHAKEPIVDVELRSWEEQYAVNLRAPFILCREAMRDMGERHSGHIINVVSTVAKASMQNYSVYTTTKYGLHGFTKCLTKEALEVGVKVTGVYPGGVDTDFRENDRPDYMLASSAAKMIVNCIMAPDDVVVHDITYRPIVEKNF
jgi:NAD(P)-dependent dehydrogenase (short-subunit alcohol dehydrogenase family)